MATSSQRVFTGSLLAVAVVLLVTVALVASLVPLPPQNQTAPHHGFVLPPRLNVSKLHMQREEMRRDVLLDYLHGFLDDQEAAGVIELARGRFKRSSVMDPATGKEISDPSRTSSSVYLDISETPLIAEIEARAAAAVGIPKSHLESLQVVEYRSGQFYRPHFDYLPENDDKRRRGQRVTTLFVYLNNLPDDEMGGGTNFPTLGIVVKPKLGAAAMWHNVDASGKEDPRMLHGGQPLEQPHSVKYGLNIWFRDRPQ